MVKVLNFTQVDKTYVITAVADTYDHLSVLKQIPKLIPVDVDFVKATTDRNYYYSCNITALQGADGKKWIYLITFWRRG